jgi:hypothetical protein
MFYLALFLNREVTGYWIVRVSFPSLGPIHNSRIVAPLVSSRLCAHLLVSRRFKTYSTSRPSIPQMHRYRIAAQIFLVLSILNLVLGAPIVVQEIHEAPRNEKWRELEAASDRSTPSPRSSPDATASPQQSSSPDGSTSSDNPHPPSLDEPASSHPSSSPSEIPPPPQLMESDWVPYSSPHRFTPSHEPSASDGTTTSLESISEVLPPSHHLMSDGLMPFNEDLMKKIGIVATVIAVGGVIAGIVGLQIKHRDYQED